MHLDEGRATEPGGPVPARSKVMVVGAAEAGKSTLIAALCPSSINLEIRGRTVAMDHGMLRRGEACVSIVGVPGQARFAGVREALFTGAAAVVWVHAAGAEVDLPTAELLRPMALPYLVYVNLHGRRAGAWSMPQAELRRPRAVIVGDLVDPMRAELGALETEIWRLTANLPRDVSETV